MFSEKFGKNRQNTVKTDQKTAKIDRNFTENGKVDDFTAKIDFVERKGENFPILGVWGNLLPA